MARRSPLGRSAAADLVDGAASSPAPPSVAGAAMSASAPISAQGELVAGAAVVVLVVLARTRYTHHRLKAAMAVLASRIP